MPTINAAKWGYARITGQTSHSAARNATTGQAISGPSGNIDPAIQYKAAASGRNLLYDIYRTYIFFNTSTATGTISNASVNITGYNSGGGRTILVPSTAFGGDGSSNLAGGDFGNISFNTNYNSSLGTWSSSGTNTFTLNSQANSDIQSNDYFICAILQYDNDYSNVALTGRGGEFNFGAAFPSGRTNPIQLIFTETSPSGPTNLLSRNNISKNDISTIMGVSYSDISEINGVT